MITLPSRAIWPVRLLGAVLILAALLGLQGAIPQWLGRNIAFILLLVGINIILAVSLNLINGITGQFSLGHAGFMAVGAYTSAAFSVYVGPQILARSQSVELAQAGIFVLAILVSALTAGFAGLVVGLPSLRLRGDYLAIVTLGFGQIIVAVITTIKEVGGALGFSNLPGLTSFVWVFSLMFLCLLSIRNLAASSLGREMRAVRDDEVAAAAVGINTTRVKVIAFVISAMWAGIAGCLQVHLIKLAQTDMFSFVRSVEIVVMVVLGGLGSITGATVTAILLTVLENVLRTVQGAFYVGLALVALAAVLSFPRHRLAFKSNKALAAVRWLGWPLLFTILLCIAYTQPATRDWFEARVSSLRFVIYALILIVLMLLRPQGLLGRGELGWHLLEYLPFGRNTTRRRAQDESADQGISGTLQ